MKKHFKKNLFFSIFFIVSLIISNCSPDTRKGPLILSPTQEIKGGKCYSIRSYDAKTEFEKVVPGNLIWDYSSGSELEPRDLYYDKNGKLVFKVCYVVNGNKNDQDYYEPYTTTEYFYAGSLNKDIIKTIQRTKNISDPEIKVNIKQWDYNSQGYLEKTSELENDTLIFKTIFKTDIKGNVTFLSKYDRKGLVYTELREFNNRDSVIKIVREKPYFPNLLKSIIVRYDERGFRNYMEYKIMFEDGVLKSEGICTDYEYDSKGRLISYIDTYRLIDPFSKEYKYNKYRDKHVTDYNKYGNIIKSDNIDLLNQSTFVTEFNLYAYEYDKNGEWISKINLSFENEPLKIITRKITKY